MFIEAQFTIAKTWIQPRWPLTDDYINEMRYIYYEVPVSQKKPKSTMIPAATKQTQLETIMLNKISQSQKAKYHYVFPYL